MPKNYKYDITLLLNCMLGLVSLPVESTNSTHSHFATSCVQKLKELGVIVKSTNDKKTFRAVKNALSHMYIEPISRNEKIHTIILRDKCPDDTQYHTKLKFSPAQLKDFSIFVANLHLERFKSQPLERQNS